MRCGNQRILKGEDAGRAKLTEKQVFEIIQLYGYSDITLKSLAKIYKVSFSTIQSITSGKNWKHLNGTRIN
jgi:hypothetical protein